MKLHWHPFWRLTTGGTFRPARARLLRPWQSGVPQPGRRWRGRGTACQKAARHLEGTVLALWEAGAQEPGLLRTALPPAARDAAWSGLRAWIAQGCTITPRAGGQWPRTRMRAPARAARLGLAGAVATLWLLRVGEAADATIAASTVLDVTALCPSRPRTRRATRLRLGSVLRQGGGARLVVLRRQEPVPQSRFVPEPWPAVPTWEEEAPEPLLALPKAA